MKNLNLLASVLILGQFMISCSKEEPTFQIDDKDKSEEIGSAEDNTFPKGALILDGQVLSEVRRGNDWWAFKYDANGVLSEFTQHAYGLHHAYSIDYKKGTIACLPKDGEGYDYRSIDFNQDGYVTQLEYGDHVAYFTYDDKKLIRIDDQEVYENNTGTHKKRFLTKVEWDNNLIEKVTETIYEDGVELSNTYVQPEYGDMDNTFRQYTLGGSNPIPIFPEFYAMMVAGLLGNAPEKHIIKTTTLIVDLDIWHAVREFNCKFDFQGRLVQELEKQGTDVSYYYKPI